MSLLAETPPHTAPTLVWRNRFATLGEAFFTDNPPTPLPDPRWVAWSPSVAADLGLPTGWMDSTEAAEVFTGNRLLPGSRPLASVYSGHQFGHWAGQLGDGRAIWLGEIDTPTGPQELQLKGAGLTPYSRMGDGRAVLRSSIREFLCSEAMHGLGIPTTRALALTASPAPVVRETVETAAVVTRVAPSFIRFGHFEHFSAAGRIDELRRLADFVIDHHYPACRQGGNPYAALLEAVSARTAELLAQWQAVGFCHGVMNTDNMSILGLTIDYGPFQFLDAYVPGHICNHSDSAGRYAFSRQPNIAYWNLFCLGQALLPLMDDQQQAIAHVPAADLPSVAQTLGEVGDVLGRGAGQHKHHDLGAALLLKGLELLLKGGHIGKGQRARLVHHASGEGWHRHQRLRPRGRQAHGGPNQGTQPQTCQSLAQAPTSTTTHGHGEHHRGQAHLPKSTLGGALMAASLATVKLALGA